MNLHAIKQFSKLFLLCANHVLLRCGKFVCVDSEECMS